MTTTSQTQDSTSDDFKMPHGVFGFRTGSRILMHLLSRYRVTGRENIPQPPFLATSNHLSYFDVPAVAGSMTMNIPALAAKKYKGTWMEPLFRVGGPVWIEQESPDREALMIVLKVIKRGSPFAIAPEGHRSRTGVLTEGKEGAAFIATRANVPIVPWVMWGTEKILKQIRPQVRVRIGKPYRLPEGRAKGDALKEYTERIMCAIAALLPEEYHGVYAGNPLIEEMGAIVR
jgi:1-acyl-sn-glycerol-3-phosphate acyltransferase